MKVSVSSTGADLGASVDPRFGRCSYFLVVDTDDLSFEAIENTSASQGSGAGVQAAQLVADTGVTAVLTGNCGPKAHKTLMAAGVDVIIGCSGTVSSVIEKLKSGKLHPSDGPNVHSHSGLRGAQ